MFALGRLVSVLLSTKFSPAFMLLCNIVRSAHSSLYVFNVINQLVTILETALLFLY